MWAPCMHADTWYNGGQSKLAPTNAPAHHSVHEMGCVFSSGLSPCVNQCCTTVNLFWLMALTFSSFGCFSILNPGLHVNLSPSYPADLVILLTYILTLLTNYQPILQQFKVLVFFSCVT